MKYMTVILMFGLLAIGSVALAADYVLITDNANPVSDLTAKEIKTSTSARRPSGAMGVILPFLPIPTRM